jgi:adenosylhomocysteine nucleosidase
MPRRLFLLFLGLLPVLLAAAQASGAEQPRPLYALLGAFPPEMAALDKEFGLTAGDGRFTVTTVHGVRFWRGSVDGHDVLVFQAGPSLVNAAFQLQLALDRYPITAVLFAGIAGGIDPALEVGDVVIPERWAYHSEAAYLNEDGHGGYVMPDFYHQPEHPNFGMIFPRSARVIADGEDAYHAQPEFAVDAALLEAARRAVAKLPPLRHAGRTVRVAVGGTGVAGTVFVDNAAYRDWVFHVWQARCLDMESTAYAQVCRANARPLLVIRGLSDLAGGQHATGPDRPDHSEVFANAVRVLRAVLGELPR